MFDDYRSDNNFMWSISVEYVKGLDNSCQNMLFCFRKNGFYSNCRKRNWYIHILIRQKQSIKTLFEGFLFNSIKRIETIRWKKLLVDTNPIITWYPLNISSCDNNKKSKKITALIL